MATPVEPGLFTFHSAPLWLRFQWWERGPRAVDSSAIARLLGAG